MSQQTDSHYGSSHEGGCYLSDDEEPLDERSKEFAVEDYAFPRLASGTIASFEDDSDSLMTPPFPEISEHSCQIDEERQDAEPSDAPRKIGFAVTVNVLLSGSVYSQRIFAGGTDRGLEVFRPPTPGTQVEGRRQQIIYLLASLQRKPNYFICRRKKRLQRDPDRMPSRQKEPFDTRTRLLFLGINVLFFNF
jgi:hypothetical protein